MNNQHSPHTAPPAAGVRLAWTALPATVRYAVEEQLGSAVVTATSQPSGFYAWRRSPPTSRRWRRVFYRKPLAPN
ncbi:MAG: hypothetical protein R2932_20945 [Caldilineaceae bacterium]